MKTPVAALIRVSTEAQAADDRAGIARQQRSIDTAVARHDLRVVQTFTLKGVSGSVVGHTPEWAEIRRLFDKGTIKGVVVDAVDRICRASELDLSVLTDIQRSGGTIYTPGEVRSLTSSSDGLITGILALLAGQEKREISRRATAGKEALRRAGRWTSDPNRLPPGIRFDKASGKWGVVEPEISIMRETFRRIGCGEISTSALAKELNVPRKTFRGRLEHPLYRGWLISDTRRTKNPLTGKITVYKRDPEDIIKVLVFDHPPIATELTDAVDARLVSNRRVYSAKGRLRGPDVHHLRGLLTCAGCGGPLSTQRRSRGHSYACRYRGCRGEMQLVDVHHAVVTALINRMSEPGWMHTAMVTALHAHREEREDPRPKIRSRLSALVSRRERLVDLHIDGALGRDEYDRRRPLLDRQVDKAEQELAQAEDRLSGDDWVDVLFGGVDGVLQFVDSFIQALPFAEINSEADVDEQLAVFDADEDVRARSCADLLRNLGGSVEVFREPGYNHPVEVRALRLDPRRLVGLLHENGGSP